MGAPAALALFLAYCNLVFSFERDWSTHCVDRIITTMAFAVILECLWNLSFRPLCWALILPGVFIMTLMILDFGYLQLKYISTLSSSTCEDSARPGFASLSKWTTKLVGSSSS